MLPEQIMAKYPKVFSASRFEDIPKEYEGRVEIQFVHQGEDVFENNYWGVYLDDERVAFIRERIIGQEITEDGEELFIRGVVFFVYNGYRTPYEANVISKILGEEALMASTDHQWDDGVGKAYYPTFSRLKDALKYLKNWMEVS